MPVTAPVPVSRLRLPDAVGSPGWSTVVALAAHLDGIQREVEGEHAIVRTPEQLLVGLRAEEYLAKPVWLAHDGDFLVGSVRVRRPLDDGASSVFAQVAVEPSHRRRGIGTALLDEVLGYAHDVGATSLQSFVLHPADPTGPVVPAATGSGGAPAANGETRFLLRHGFTLQQANLGSMLRLPVDEAAVDAVEQETAPRARDYDVLTWTAPTPDALVDDLALLRRRMSTDAPSADRDTTEEHWNAARVRHHDDVQAAAGRTVLYAGAVHRDTARLVAFTELWLDPDPRTTPDQLDTLVLREHRGHGLGLLVKIANLRRLQAERPLARVVKTFNAAENEPMLAVNRRLGFEPHMVSGAWQRRLA